MHSRARDFSLSRVGGSHPGSTLPLLKRICCAHTSLHEGINPVPEVRKYVLPRKDQGNGLGTGPGDPIMEDGTEQILLLASDGVWEFVSNSAAKDMVYSYVSLQPSEFRC